MGSLLFINFTLWDFCNRLKRLEKFLAWLENEVRLKSLDTNHSVETLLWIFWRDDANDGMEFAAESDVESHTTSRDNPNLGRTGITVANNVEERNWFVTRMLRVAKRLGSESWEKVRQTLVSFLLAPEDDEKGSAPVVVEGSPDRSRCLKKLPWNDNELRKEILANLYVCPPTSKEPG
jgi:hypothetical protein